jgi:hypothetical protein
MDRVAVYTVENLVRLIGVCKLSWGSLAWIDKRFMLKVARVTGRSFPLMTVIECCPPVM